jgi:hypothetical protein
MPIDTGLVAAIQDTVNSAFDYKMESVNTAIPCIVIAVRDSGSGQMVDIQPTINQKLQDGTVKERPPIYGVPISFPVSSKAGMTFPIEVGTTGTAIFSMRDMEAWKVGNGRPSTPQTAGKMSASDAMFYPGIQPPGSAINNPSKHVLTHSTSDTVMFSNLGGVEAEVRIKADGSIEVNTSNQPVTINCSIANVNASQEINLTSPQMNVDVQQTSWVGDISHIGATTQTGNYTQMGIYTLNSVNVNIHTHPGVMSGPSSTGPMI